MANEWAKESTSFCTKERKLNKSHCLSLFCSYVDHCFPRIFSQMQYSNQWTGKTIKSCCAAVKCFTMYFHYYDLSNPIPSLSHCNPSQMWHILEPTWNSKNYCVLPRSQISEYSFGRRCHFLIIELSIRPAVCFHGNYMLKVMLRVWGNGFGLLDWFRTIELNWCSPHMGLKTVWINKSWILTGNLGMICGSPTLVFYMHNEPYLARKS